ncbi:hypothetical protein PCE1_004730 [Barthelona sp. PCE]
MPSRLLEVPDSIDFRHTSVGEVQTVTFRVRNLSSSSRVVRLKPPKLLQFKLNAQPRLPLAPGLSLEFSIEYHCQNLEELCDEIVIESPLKSRVERFTIPIFTHVPKGNIIIPDSVLFGNIVTGIQVSKEFELFNDGDVSSKCNFLIDVEGVEIVPSSVSLESKERRKITVSVNPEYEGSFRALISCERTNCPNHMLDISYVAFAHEVRITHAGLPLEKLDFGGLFWGQSMIKEVCVQNSSALPIMCDFTVTNKSTIDDDTAESRLTETRMTTFEMQVRENGIPEPVVTPGRFSVQPFSEKIIKINVELPCVGSFVKPLKGHFPCTLKSVPFFSGTGRDSTRFVGESLDQEQHCSVYYTAVSPFIELSDAFLAFRDYSVHQRASQSFKVSNVVAKAIKITIPQQFSFLKFMPSEFILEPLGVTTVKAIFSPNNLLTRQNKNIAVKCSPVDGDEVVFERKLSIQVEASHYSSDVTATRKEHFAKGVSRTIKDFEKFNDVEIVPSLKEKAEIEASMTKDLFRTMNPEDAIRTVKDLKGSRKSTTLNTGVMTWKRKTKMEISEKEDDHNLGYNPLDHLIAPEPILPAVLDQPLVQLQNGQTHSQQKTLRLVHDQTRLYRRKFFKAPSGFMDMNIPSLSGDEISNLIHCDFEYNLGTVVVFTNLKRSFNIKNTSRQVVKVELRYSHIPELQHTLKDNVSGVTQYIPPDETAGFDLDLSFTRMGPLRRKIFVYINNEQVWELLLLGNVREISIQTDKEQLDFSMSVIPEKWWLQKQIITLTNASNSNVKVKWLDEEGCKSGEITPLYDNPNVPVLALPVFPLPNTLPVIPGSKPGHRFFYLEKNEFIIPSSGSIDVMVHFLPGIISEYNEKLILEVVGGKTLSIDCSAKLPDTQLDMSASFINFGTVGVGMSRSRSITITNPTAQPVQYFMNQFTPSNCVRVPDSKRYGTLLPYSSTEIMVEFKSSKKVKLKGKNMLRRRGVLEKKDNGLVKSSSPVDNMTTTASSVRSGKSRRTSRTQDTYNDTASTLSTFSRASKLFEAWNNSVLQFSAIGSGKVHYIALQGEAAVPDITFSTPMVSFENIQVNFVELSELSVKNNAKLPVVLLVDFSKEGFADFDIVAPNNDNIKRVVTDGLSSPYPQFEYEKDAPNPDSFALETYSPTPFAFSTIAPLDPQRVESKVYRISVGPLSTVEFMLEFKPKVACSITTKFPISYPGFSASYLPIPMIKATSEMPSVLLNKGEVNFFNKIVVPPTLKKAIYHEEVILTNTSDHVTRFTAAFENQTTNNPFKLNISSGILAPNTSTSVQVTYWPREVSSSENKIIFIEEGSETIFGAVNVKGVALAPFMRFDPPVVQLPTVPVHDSVTVTVVVEAFGINNGEFEVILPPDQEHFPFEVDYIDGQSITYSTNRIRINITFMPNRPLSFDTRIQAVLHTIEGFAIKESFRLIGMSDIAIINTWPTLATLRDGSFTRLLASTGNLDTVQIPQQMDLTEVMGNVTDLIRPLFPLFCEDTTSVNLFSTCVRYLNIAISKVVLPVDIEAFALSQGRLLLNAVEDLTSKQMSGVAERFRRGIEIPPSVIIENVRKILVCLQSYGCLVNTIKPQYLCSKDVFVEYCTIECLSIFPRNYICPEGTELMLNKYFADHYVQVSVQAYTLIVLQLIRTFLLVKLSKKSILGVVARYADVSPQNVKMVQSQFSGSLSLEESYLIDWCHNIVLTFKENNVKKLPFLKNIKGIHNNNDTFIGALLSEGVMYTLLLYAYCPFLIQSSEFNAMLDLLKEYSKAQGDALSSSTCLIMSPHRRFKMMSLFLEVCTYIGLPSFCDAHQLISEDPRVHIMVLNYLYTVLPPYSSSTPLTFSGEINTSMRQDIELRNPNKRDLFYRVAWFNNNGLFRLTDKMDNSSSSLSRIGSTLSRTRSKSMAKMSLVDKKDVKLDPDSKKLLNLSFFSTFSKDDVATLLFLPVHEDNGGKLVGPIIFTINFKTKPSLPLFTMTQRTPLYQSSATAFDVDMEKLEFLNLFNKDTAEITFSMRVSQKFLTHGEYERVKDNPQRIQNIMSAHAVSATNAPSIQKLIEMYDENDHKKIRNSLIVPLIQTPNLVLKKLRNNSFGFKFCPLFYGVYVIDVLFFNSTVGEFLTRFFLVADLPDKTRGFDFINAFGEHEQIDVISNSLSLQYSNHKIGEAVVEYPIAGQFFDHVFNSDGEKSKSLQYEAYWNNSMFTSADRVSLINRESDPRNVLSFTFKPKGSGLFDGVVLLRSVFDMRVYNVSCMISKDEFIGSMEFTTAVRHPIDQDIPIHNSSDETWQIDCILSDSSMFTISTTMLTIAAGQTSIVKVVYTASKMDQSETDLILKNSSTKETLKYHLIGKTLEPKAEDRFVYKCASGRVLNETLHLNNPYMCNETIVYRVESDIECIGGSSTVSVPANARTIDFHLQIHPKLPGVYNGVLRFVGAGDRTMWYDIEVQSNIGEAIGTLDCVCEVMKTKEVSLQLMNPLDEPITYKINYMGHGLFGPNFLPIAPKSRQELVFYFSPVRTDEFLGRAIFYEESIGEFSYDLQLKAVSKPAQRIPQLITTIGDITCHPQTIKNPLNHSLEMKIVNTNRINFGVSDIEMTMASSIDPLDSITLEAFEEREIYFFYRPSSVRVVEESVITFEAVDSNIDRLEFELRGTGRFPQQGKVVTFESSVGIRQLESIPFRNPFARPIHVRLSLDKSTVFSLEGPSNVTIPPYQLAMIPIIFEPTLKARFTAELHVSDREEDITWTFSLVGIGAFKSIDPSHIIKLNCRAREPLRKEVSLLLPLFYNNATPAVDDINELISYSRRSSHAAMESHKRLRLVFEWDVEPEMKDYLQNILVIEPDNVVAQSNMLNFAIVLDALKPFHARGDLKIMDPQGGYWVFQVEVNVNSPVVDDVIYVPLRIGETSKLSFDLKNVFEEPEPFTAYLTPQSNPCFVVLPTQGTLAGVNDMDGTEFIISFTPEVYGIKYKARLIITTERMQWTYDLQAVQPSYRPPKVGPSIVTSNITQNNQASGKKRNFMRENISKTITTTRERLNSKRPKVWK